MVFYFRSKMAELSIMVSIYQSIYFKQGRIYGINRLPSLFLPAKKRGYGLTEGPTDGPIDGHTLL